MLLIDYINRSPQLAKKSLEELFVSEVITPGTLYTSTPTGRPNVGKIMQNDQNCWMVGGESRKTSSIKHIVISDFTLKSNGHLKKQIVDYLPQDGDDHRLFILQDDKLVEVKSIDDLNKIDYSKIKPVTTQKIKRLLFADPYGIPSEQCTILDIARNRQAYNLLNRISEGLSDILINIDDLKDVPGILEFLEEENFKDLKVSISAWGYDQKKLETILNLASKIQSYCRLEIYCSNKIPELVNKKLSDYNLYIDSRDKELTDDVIGYINNGKIKSLSATYLEDKSIDILLDQDLSQLEEIDIRNTSIDEKKLVSLLEKTPNLKKIHVWVESGEDDLTEEMMAKMNLSKLENIYFLGLAITGKNLALLLKKAPNLKNIFIRNYKHINDLIEEIADKIDLSRLEKISLGETPISGKNLARLLKKTTNLRKIHLGRCSKWNLIEEKTQEIDLSQLETIELSRPTISTKSIVFLLKNAPNLIEIDLTECKNINDLTEEMIKGLDLNKLEKINLSDSNISGEKLAWLLKKAPNLVKIYLRHCPNINNSLTEEMIKGINLNQLKFMDLSNTNISGKNLVLLLKNALNLIEIDLAECKNIDDLTEEMIKGLDLNKLEKIDLSESNISGKNLALLLKNAHNLERIYFEDKTNIGDLTEEMMKGVDLSKLEVIALSNSNISGKNLALLLKNAPNLKRVFLARCTNINDLTEDMMKKIELKHLEELDLSNSTCSSARHFAASISKRSPNLKKINLEGCVIIPPSIDKNKIVDANTLSKSSSYGSKIGNNNSPKPVSSNIDKAQNTDGLIKDDPDELLHARKIFTSLGSDEDPKVEDYRINVYDELNESYEFKSSNDDLEKVDNPPFSKTDPLLENVNDKQNKYYGKFELLIPSGKLSPLPSLSAKDELESLYILDSQAKQNLEVYYSKKHNLYYLKNTSDIPIQTKASFVINIKTTTSKHDDVVDKNKQSTKVRECINQLIKDCSDFGTADKNIEGLSGKELLKKLWQERKGACRHRSQVFLWQVQKLKKQEKLSKDFAVRIITNDCHQYVEIKYGPNQPWDKIDLGGYSSNISTSSIDMSPPTSSTNFIEKKEDSLNKLQTSAIDQEKQSTNAIEQKELPLEKMELQEIQSTNIIKPKKPLLEKIELQLPELKITEEKLEPPLEEQPPPVVQPVVKQVEIDTFFTNIIESSNKNQQDKSSNILLSLPQGDIDRASLYMHLLAQQHGKQVYYIDNPGDLVCNTATLNLTTLDENTGLYGATINKGGSGLDKFLENKDNKNGKDKILVINWNNFSRDKFISCHTVIDKDRNIQGVKLPSEMIVVSLYPTDSNACYSGNDFIERHNIRITNNYNSQELDQKTKNIEKEQIKLDGSKIDQPIEIELYESEQWQDYLIGSWQFTDSGMKFKPGPLINALEQNKDNKPIVLKNAPWHMRDFVLFWLRLMIERKLTYYGKAIELPKKLKIYQNRGYNYELYKNQVIDKPLESKETKTYVLNPLSFLSFITNYKIDVKNEKLVQKEGIFEKSKDGNLNLLVTANINLGQWYELLQKASEYGVKLHISLAPNITLPPELNRLKEKVKTAKPIDYETKDNKSVIYLVGPKEIDGVVTQLVLSAPEETKPKIITISDYDPSDIFYHTTINKKNNNESGFTFTEKECDILIALKNGETVILKGHVSPIFADYLSGILTQGYILHNGEKETFKGKLIVVSDSEKNLSFCKDIKKTPPNIKQQATITPAVKKTENLQWQKSVLDNNSKKLAEKWFEERENLLKGALKESKWVSIEGTTGVGKSTFINHKLKDCNVFNGLEKISNWVHCKNDNNKDFNILFIDEANLTGKDLAMFRDLDNKPPTIILNGEYIQLSDKHRVVLASNPATYGGRIAPELVRDCALKIEFHPIPPIVLFEEILKNLRPQQISDEKWRQISEKWLKIYDLVNANKEEPIVSPRHLESMALLLGANITQEEKDEVILQKAENIAYRILGPYASYNAGFFNIENEDKDKAFIVPSPNDVINMSKNSFIYTDSRLEAYNACLDFLTIRESGVRIDGLGGILLEGEPGIGKSEFMLSMLKTRGYTEYKEEDQKNENILNDGNNKRFVKLPSDASYEKKKEILDMAYQRGYVVIMDELNTPLAENLLNDLVGTKKIEENIAKGFMVFGTQNPAYMAGRDKTSSALKNRLLCVTLPSYTKNELYQIEKKRYVNIQESDLEKILVDFIKMQQEAREKCKDPISYRLLRDYLGYYSEIIERIDKEKNLKKVQTVSQSLLKLLTLKEYKNKPFEVEQTIPKSAI